MKESSYQSKLKKRMESEGCVVIKHHSSGYGEAGIPDLWFGGPTSEGWIEVKVGRNRPTPKQQHVIRKLLDADVNAVVIRRAEDGAQVIETADGVGRAELLDSSTVAAQITRFVKTYQCKELR